MEVESTRLILNKYNNTGTVSIEPPPPIKPSDIPINKEVIYPTISITAKMVKFLCRHRYISHIGISSLIHSIEFL